MPILGKRRYIAGGTQKRARAGSVSVPRGGLRLSVGTAAYAGPRRMGPMASRGFFGANERLKRQLQGIEEKKVVETASAAYGIDTTGSITAINLAAQGTDFTNRIGRKTTNVAVQLEGYIQNVDNTTTPSLNRVLIIYDAQPNGGTPAMTDIFTASTANSFMNLNNRDRFKVLAETSCALGGIDTTATQTYAQSPSVHAVRVYKRINLDTIWTGTTAAVGSVGTGAIWLVTVGSNPAATGNLFVGACRVRFVDA